VSSHPDQSEERTRSPLDAASPPSGGRVVAFWEGGFSAVALPESGELTIGRSKSCDLYVQHATVSREHARLRIGATTLLIDCGSSNGTKVGGIPVPAGGERAVLPGQLVELGSAVIAIQPAPGELPAVRDRATLEEVVTLVAESDISVIILGETGVGKDRVAERIHTSSARAGGPFVRLNCAALVESLLESELFGHERGAFTGAHAAKPGLLEAAHAGTLFLDEVAELSASTQAKLLRVLESGELSRVGSVTPRAIDVRFVAATNESLDALVASGAFRRDLYFRLAGMVIHVPPLRARRDEIPGLALEIATHFCARTNRPAPGFSTAAVTLLMAHAWPGNIRELRNVVERALVLSRGSTVQPEHLALTSDATARAALSSPAPGQLVQRGVVEEIERRRILDALDQTGGNQTAAAELLGVSRRTLVNRLNAFGFPRPRKR
jgi:two-component system, NtrC family, response regulator AtoC